MRRSLVFVPPARYGRVVTGRLAAIADQVAEATQGWAERLDRRNRVAALGMSEEEADLLVSSVAAMGFTAQEAIDVLTMEVQCWNAQARDHGAEPEWPDP